MSFFGDIVNKVEGAVSDVVHTAEDVVGGGLKAAGGFVEGAVSDVLHNPLDLLNPFAVVSGGVKGAIGAFEHSPITNFPGSAFKDISKFLGGDDALGDLGGSSIEAVLLKLAQKERGRLADKVDQLKNLQAPGKDATPQQQADFDSQKVNLMADIQSIQNSIQQITTMATNVQKQSADNNMAVIRNMA